ncbi:uncharacterized protein EV154DRAFT_515408 [Mucor mucedo]|uniref:uncharacterized protein n=1 Tax=Mucor mucedo TaxID=29922 RepID=UPI002220C8AE|nr:uncharacterized protein EV154DRAFT_515408 [Mucor mucedo]KAI7889231.1 hypothetical protein EV154DRAFT_515408 [Mucor mucedo]
MMTDEERACTIFDLSLDIKYLVLNYLDNRSLAYLAQTCKYFGMLVRNIVSFRSAKVNTIDDLMPTAPPFLNYRAGVSVGNTFYIPFMNENPFCYSFDLIAGVWSSHRLNLIDMTEVQPQITSATVVGTKIYLVGGRLLKSYTLSNSLIEIDITNFNTRMVTNAQGLPPRPRHEHSLDAIGDRYLIVFGGLCYNSVGKEKEERHVPHLRFGHASAVIGHSLYIHGGAQLDNDSTYIIYDDLYKLDCQTWSWYKYEHPEVEKYLRGQMLTPGDAPQREHLISTTGDSPLDRFQSYMVSYGNKLIIFGGHSIREDEDDNEILCSYPLDELSVFNTKRNAWTYITAETTDEEPITISDMSVATLPMGSRGVRVYVFAGRKAAEIPRVRIASRSKLSHSSSSNHSAQDSFNAPHLPSITETNSIYSDDEELNNVNEIKRFFFFKKKGRAASH